MAIVCYPAYPLSCPPHSLSAKSLSVRALAVFFYYFAALLAQSQNPARTGPGQRERSIKITHSQTNKMLTAYISVSVPATVFS